MSRHQSLLRKSAIAAAAIALCASASAFADDNSMSQWTGDSYAYFNNLDYSLGKFNVARAPRTDAESVATPSKAPQKDDKRVLLATRPATGTRTNPFSDDKGA